jgi:hypothetical protein
MNLRSVLPGPVPGTPLRLAPRLHNRGGRAKTGHDDG